MLNNSEPSIFHAFPAPAGAKVNKEVPWTVSEPAKADTWAMLYHKYVDVLFDYGMQMCHNRGIVLDCLNELFTRVRKRPEKLSGDPTIKAYLFKSLRDLLVHRIIENRHASSLGEQNAFEFVSIPDTLAINDDARASQAIRMKNSLESLQVSQREMMYLKCCMGLTHYEIALVTGMQVESVNNLVSKVIELLCKKVKVQDSPIPLL